MAGVDRGMAPAALAPGGVWIAGGPDQQLAIGEVDAGAKGILASASAPGAVMTAPGTVVPSAGSRTV
jgi:hypothetical protein